MGPNLWSNPMLRQSATYGTKYRVRQIVHKTTRADIISRTLQAAVIVKLNFRNLKSTKNNNNKFLKYKISICLDHTNSTLVIDFDGERRWYSSIYFIKLKERTLPLITVFRKWYFKCYDITDNTKKKKMSTCITWIR